MTTMMKRTAIHHPAGGALSLLAVVVVCCLACPARAASFYGASYVSLPLQEAKSTTELSFRFRTSRSDALVLLAAGRTDYCLVVMQSGALKVRINLGSGEAEVGTPRAVRFDDLAWHEVRIQRRDADFTLNVDGLHSSKLKLPGRFYELNIHYGLFVGGLGDFREIFLGLWDNFRGCIADLVYNGVDVLAKAKDRDKTSVQGDAATSHGVSWDCSGEFDATSQQDVSFLAADSYATFAGTGIAKTGSTLRFQIATQTRDCVLLYSTGPPAKPDFAAVELVEGHVRVSLDAGGGGVDLFSDAAVNDGQWHQIELHLAAGRVDMTIDGRPSSGGNAISASSGASAASSPASKYLELNSQIYLGGVEPVRQARALIQGVRTANSSLRGCVRRLELDGKTLGLREAKVTRHVAPDCRWHYPCTALRPCNDGAQCYQDGVDHFRCDCPSPPCTRPEFVGYRYATPPPGAAGSSQKGSDVQPAVANLSPVQVTEGGSMTLTSRHLQVQLDYEKYGVRESGVLFHVARPPQHGRLSSSLWRRADEATFTLLDVHSDRVRYVHDGSETQRDAVTLELELSPRPDFLLPAYLQRRQQFVLHFAVSPVNDPPELTLAPGKVLRLVKHSRKALTHDLLLAADPDNAPKDLVYSVLNAKSDGDMEGTIESRLQPNVAISSFTQEDVNQGRIWYVHRGSPSGRLALRVSDGAESGPTAVLRVAAFDLQLFMANNTGLLVPVNGSAPITAANLTFTTNAPDQDLDVRYDVTRPPQHGQLQLWRSGRWQSISWFTSGQLERGERIRYSHSAAANGSQPWTNEDDFQFAVSVQLEAGDVFRSPTLYQFRVQLLDAVLREDANRGLVLQGSASGVIGPASLRFVTEPHATADDELVYTLVEPPVYGALWIQQQPEPLGAGFKWTQSIINSQRLQYRLARRTLSALRDRFTFRVATAALVTETHRFDVTFAPSEPSPVDVYIERVKVNEGESAVLPAGVVKLSVPFSINYTVLEGPFHGRLNLLDVAKKGVLREAIGWFTTDDLADQRVVYAHDDGESTSDTVQFVARPRVVADPSQDFQYVGELPVAVRMKNDNAPVRSAERSLRIVTNGERKLGADILRYDDPDVDTKPEDIMYTRRGVPNGAFYLAERPDVPVFQFSQADVNQGKILFRHSGPSYGRTTIWVTDGQHHVTGTLEVEASDPFMERVNQTHLTVRRGQSSLLGTSQLGMASNMDFYPEELSYYLLEEPRLGYVQLDGTSIAKSESFTLSDVLAGRVSYQSNNRSEGKDWFKVRAVLRMVDYSGSVEVRVFPDSYWLPIKVANNQLATVEEGTSFTIDSSSLRADFASGVNPSDIVYTVHSPPVHGYLEVDRDDSEYEEMAASRSANLLPPEVHLFDQAAINENRLHYIQSGANQSADQFAFDVTNGVVTISNLTFHLAIIPKSIYLLARPIEVLEGGHTALTVSDLKIVTRYYADKVDAFLVVRLPVRGSLQLKGAPSGAEPLARFTYGQLLEKQVLYWHDGGEESNDSMEIVALAGKKESLPATILIDVRPVDDERPVLVNNTGIMVWQGSTTLLDRSQLGASDVDTIPQSIEFTFGKTDCGYMATGPNLTDPVFTFSQEQINRQQIAFVHKGRTNCSVSFNLTDGQSIPSSHQLQISARKMQVRLVRNHRLHVFPMMQQSITSAQLLAITSGDIVANQNVPRFQVTRPPRLGRLLLELPDGSTKRISSFTQRDLNQSLVIYEHTEPFADLSVNDSFVFDVTSDLSSPLTQQLFTIDISVATMAEGGLDRYLGLVQLETEEGGKVAIREKNLNLSGIIHLISNYQGVLAPEPPRLRLLVSQTPFHGFLSADGRRVDAGGEIAMDDIIAGRVEYQHDHSDTLEDWIGLTVFLQRPNKVSPSERPDILLFNGTLHVNVLPINDQAFHLLTKAPAMTVVQRQWRPITPDVLLTEDADTSARDLIYEIIQPPKYGTLAVTSDGSATGAAAVSPTGSPLQLRFSQEDINRGRVVYRHDGTMDPRSTSFYFRVSDGAHRPDSGVFTIHFEQLTLKMANHSNINIVQGQSTTIVNNSSMGAESNGQRRHIFYNVTKEPDSGKLFVNDVQVTTFGQSNIDKEELVYVQFNMTASSDSFEVTVWNLAVSYERLLFNVTVVPLLAAPKRPIRATVGEKTLITTDTLDAGRLASLTNSNPTFTILRKPRYGKIRKIVPSSSGSALNRLAKRQLGSNGNNKEKDTNIFTHEDVQSQFIFYVPKKLENVNETQLVDSCEYRLTAPNVQPAVGTLEFYVILPPGSTLVAASKNSIETQSGNGNFVNSRAPASNDVSTTENTFPGIGLGMMGNDVLLIVGVVCGILGLGVVTLIIIKCRMKSSLQKQPKNDQNASAGDMQLYRLSGSLKNGHSKSGMPDFQVTDAYRIPANMHHHGRDFGDTDSDPEPPPPPRLDYLDPPLSPRPSRAMRGIGASPISASSTISSLHARTRGSWQQQQQQQHESSSTPTSGMGPSVPQCKIIPLLNPLLSERSESETSELVNARYPYGIADESMEEWAMLEPEVHCNSSTYSSRTTNPMLRKNQYWV